MAGVLGRQGMLPQGLASTITSLAMGHVWYDYFCALLAFDLCRHPSKVSHGLPAFAKTCVCVCAASTKAAKHNHCVPPCCARLIATRGFLRLICQHLQDSPLPAPVVDPSAASCSQASLSQRSSLSGSRGVNLLQVGTRCTHNSKAASMVGCFCTALGQNWLSERLSRSGSK